MWIPGGGLLWMGRERGLFRKSQVWLEADTPHLARGTSPERLPCARTALRGTALGGLEDRTPTPRMVPAAQGEGCAQASRRRRLPAQVEFGLVRGEKVPRVFLPPGSPPSYFSSPLLFGGVPGQPASLRWLISPHLGVSQLPQQET